MSRMKISRQQQSKHPSLHGANLGTNSKVESPNLLGRIRYLPDGSPRRSCSCQDCIGRCLSHPGPLVSQDLLTLCPQSKSKNYSDLLSWAKEHLRASEGTLVVELFPDFVAVTRLGSLTPLPVGLLPNRPDSSLLTVLPVAQEFEDSSYSDGYRCHWLLPDNKCAVHADAPLGCAAFQACGESEVDLLATARAGLIAAARHFGTGNSKIAQGTSLERLYIRIWCDLFKHDVERGYRVPPHKDCYHPMFKAQKDIYFGDPNTNSLSNDELTWIVDGDTEGMLELVPEWMSGMYALLESKGEIVTTMDFVLDPKVHLPDKLDTDFVLAHLIPCTGPNQNEPQRYGKLKS